MQTILLIVILYETLIESIKNEKMNVVTKVVSEIPTFTIELLADVKRIAINNI